MVPPRLYFVYEFAEFKHTLTQGKDRGRTAEIHFPGLYLIYHKESVCYR